MTATKSNFLLVQSSQHHYVFFVYASAEETLPQAAETDALSSRLVRLMYAINKALQLLSSALHSRVLALMSHDFCVCHGISWFPCFISTISANQISRDRGSSSTVDFSPSSKMGSCRVISITLGFTSTTTTNKDQPNVSSFSLFGQIGADVPLDWLPRHQLRRTVGGCEYPIEACAQRGFPAGYTNGCSQRCCAFIKGLRR